MVGSSLKQLWFLVGLVLLVSCSPKNTIHYPLSLRFSDYSPCDYNLIWLQTYENRKRDIYYSYYGIVDVPIDNFLAVRYPRPGIGGGMAPIVYARTDKKVSPIDDWTVDYLELLTIDCDYFLRRSEVDWERCGQSYVIRELSNLDLNTSSLIIQCIKEYKDNYRNDPDSVAELRDVSYEDWNGARCFKEVHDDAKQNCCLAIRIHFQNYANIVMDVQLVELSNDLYIIFRIGKEVSYINKILIPVPEEAIQIIQNVANDSGLELSDDFALFSSEW